MFICFIVFEKRLLLGEVDILFIWGEHCNTLYIYMSYRGVTKFMLAGHFLGESGRAGRRKYSRRGRRLDPSVPVRLSSWPPTRLDPSVPVRESLINFDSFLGVSDGADGDAICVARRIYINFPIIIFNNSINCRV